MKKLLYVVAGLIAGVLLTLAYINYSQKPAEYLQAEQFIEDQLLLALEVESMEFVRTFTGRDSALLVLSYMENLPREKQLIDLLEKEWKLVHYYDQHEEKVIGEIWKAELENKQIIYLLSVNDKFIDVLPRFVCDL